MSEPVSVWIDGKVLSAEETPVSPFDRGFQYGDGVFETLRAERGKVFFVEAHLERLQRGLEVLGIDFPGAAPRATEGLGALLELMGSDRTWGFKVIVTRGLGPTGPTSRGEFTPGVVVFGGKVDPERPEGMRAVTTGVVRNERSPLATIKSLNYAEMLIARAEAERVGVDEGICLNTQGRIAEASAANVFLVKEGRLLTPPEGEGCLPGIVRREVLGCASELGIDSAEEPLSPGDLKAADELFLTNSRIGVAPLVVLDGQAVGEGSAGPVTSSLREAFRKAEYASGQEL